MNEHENDWELQLNQLLDGELEGEALQALQRAAAKDPELERAVRQAHELQQLMGALPAESAPDSLRQKLAAIPERDELAADVARLNEQRPRAGLRWRWLSALAVVPLVFVLLVQQSGPTAPSDAELAQAREDLALALAYLDKATRVTERELSYTIGAAMRDPIEERTLRSITEQLNWRKEQDA